VTPLAALAAALVLGAAAPPPAAEPAPAGGSLDAPIRPEQWGIVTSLPGNACGAKAPNENGLDLNIALSPGNTISLIIGNPAWRIEPHAYEVIMQLDEFPPFTYSMVGQGPALIGEIPADFRAEFMTAGKIGIRFNGATYSVPVRNLSGVVARLQTCVEAKRAAGGKQ
jgi:hypothetical protein